MTDGQLYSMYIAFCMALTAAGAHETVRQIDSEYGQLRSLEERTWMSPQERRETRPTIPETLHSILIVPDGTDDEETGGSAYAPIDVPESCVMLRDQLIDAVSETQALTAEAKAAEAAAGWDPSP